MTDEEMLSYMDRPFKFWRCPNPDHRTVTWNGDIARCDECGQTNQAWQTGYPPNPGWYIVTEEYPSIGASTGIQVTCMKWIGACWLDPEDICDETMCATSSKIRAWQPLPEPYQGNPDS
jgi:hypothetical protein